MVQCVIVGCCNRTLRHQKSKVFIVSLLKTKSFSKNGSSKFKRENLPNIQHCHICSDHFEPSCFDGVLATRVDATAACNWWNVNFVTPSIPFISSEWAMFSLFGRFQWQTRRRRSEPKSCFCKQWHSLFKLGFINFATITKMFIAILPTE